MEFDREFLQKLIILAFHQRERQGSFFCCSPLRCILNPLRINRRTPQHLIHFKGDRCSWGKNISPLTWLCAWEPSETEKDKTTVNTKLKGQHCLKYHCVLWEQDLPSLKKYSNIFFHKHCVFTIWPKWDANILEIRNKCHNTANAMCSFKHFFIWASPTPKQKV